MLSFTDVLPAVMDEWREKSKSRLYENDIEAWASDVLGERFWSKQREFVQSFQENRRTAVKSANGTGKSRAVGVVICHWVTVCERPGDNLALVTGPSLKTVRDVVWQYLTDFYNKALDNDVRFPGTLYSSIQDLAWRVPSTGKAKPSNMALGLKPGDGTDIIGAFQGRRGRVKTAVFADEAGSLHPDIYTAAEAVATGPESRHLFIGNPDNGRGSEFFRIFNEPGMEKDWKHFTIRAFDLPTFTGEIVYPNDPDKQEALLNSGMPDEAWVDNKRRMWGEGTGRWKAKVLGEFPDDDDNALFSQTAINRAYETDIPDEVATGEPLILGVDMAFGGMDETVIYSNRGGKVRFVTAKSKMEPLENARFIHKIAQEKGAELVRMDASSVGEGVFDMLDKLDEFYPRTYDIVGVKGGNPSPDYSQWAQARSWHYDTFRHMMLRGEIDLDVTDKVLGDELISQTYEVNLRGALQVTTKREMRRHGLPSPDHLDAAIYASVDPFWDDPYKTKTEMYENEEILERFASEDTEFLADYRAYRW